MAAYISKRFASSILDWKTPFELLYNKKPDFVYIKVFGCLCYTTNTLTHKDKFSLRAFTCIFIRYSLDNRHISCMILLIKILISLDFFFSWKYFFFIKTSRFQIMSYLYFAFSRWCCTFKELYWISHWWWKITRNWFLYFPITNHWFFSITNE